MDKNDIIKTKLAIAHGKVTEYGNAVIDMSKILYTSLFEVYGLDSEVYRKWNSRMQQHITSPWPHSAFNAVVKMKQRFKPGELLDTKIDAIDDSIKCLNATIEAIRQDIKLMNIEIELGKAG